MPGILVKYPTPKATTSVILVTVMETPAWDIVLEISSGILVSGGEVFLTLLRHWTMTNISSMPIPRHRKGRIAWTSVNGYPIAEAIPIDMMNPRTTLVIPASEHILLE